MIWQAAAPLPTESGLLEIRAFEFEGVEHIALLAGNVAGADLLVRIHSECLTGEAFGSLKCDCAAQLDDALERVSAEGRGLVLYLRQEGRGIGLTNKIRAYALQAAGADTVDANVALGLPEDGRDYRAAAAALRDLGVRSVRLITNNPDKCRAIQEAGIPVTRVPSHVAYPDQAQGYLDTKRDRMRHLLPGARAMH